MPFRSNEESYGPLALPENYRATPEDRDVDTSVSSVLGAAFRTENPIASALSSFQFDPLKPFDPEYDPWLDIQGTPYEFYSDRFAGARDKEDVIALKGQIDRETEDRTTLQAAGGWGMMSQFGAALLSPSTLIPGGAIIKGARGVSIAGTSLSVASSAALAAGLDEMVLQGTQETRTGEETALTIGGSVILGGLLGAAAGKMTRADFAAASKQAEQAVQVQYEYTEALRSMGAAENRADLTLRREELFQAVNKIPVLRGIVRSDPILRAQLSPNREARQALVDLVETPLQYKVNDQGKSVRNGEASVETVIKDRERNELAKAMGFLARSFAEYSKDGPVGVVGTITAPITSRFSNLMGQSSKLSQGQFLEEVGKAMRRGDKHPIPQVQSAADALRREIFDKVKDEATELGMFDDGLQLKNADSYFTRVYDINRIERNFGNGTGDDMAVTLKTEFMKRRAAAIKMLEEDATLNELEVQKLTLQEQARTAQQALNKARQKATEKRDRAKSAQKREGAVGRATGSLRRLFENRSENLSETLLSPEETASLKAILKDARSVANIEPPSLLKRIRQMGGIQDLRGTRLTRKGKELRDAKPTELETILDTKAHTIRRDDGRPLDEIREMLAEEGYLPMDATEAGLLDLIRREVGGEKIYSEIEDAAALERYQAAQDFISAMEEMGVDISKPFDQIVKKLTGNRNPAVTKAKAGEAARSGKAAGKKEATAEDRLTQAADRLEDAVERLRLIDEEIAPKVRAEIEGATKELRKTVSMIGDAKRARETETFYAGMDDAELDEAVVDTIRSIIGLKPGQHSYEASLSSPTRARVLDVADEVLEPWLIDDAGAIMSQYFRALVPDLELTRKFGDVNMTETLEKVRRETMRLAEDAKSPRKKQEILDEGRERLKDLEGMRDRLRNRYGVPANPRSIWVQGNRTLRTMSFAGFLGGMTVSAIPDIASMVGRNGIEAALGSVSAITNPRKFGVAVREQAELGAAAEWWLNSRAHSIAEMFDPNGQGTRLERTLGTVSNSFAKATGMIGWNIGWKSVGMAYAGSRFAKAADAVSRGTASKKQLRMLAENDIEPWMAERIAKEIKAHGDTSEILWLPRGQDWTDREAFLAFRRAMNRESDLMVITPGQDKPLTMSTEVGKFFLQFKSFMMSAHHRILLSGIQRADADVMAQFTAAMVLGGLVSNIKADLGGYDRKEGSAFWEDAIDRSGLAGWLFEPYNAASSLSGGAISVSGEPVSRYQARSQTEGLLGPSVDMGFGVVEGINGFASGKQTYRDVRKMMRPVPGNNLVYLLPLFQQVEDFIVGATGAKPRD